MPPVALSSDDKCVSLPSPLPPARPFSPCFPAHVAQLVRVPAEIEGPVVVVPRTEGDDHRATENSRVPRMTLHEANSPHESTCQNEIPAQAGRTLEEN